MWNNVLTSSNLSYKKCMISTDLTSTTSLTLAQSCLLSNLICVKAHYTLNNKGPHNFITSYKALSVDNNNKNCQHTVRTIQDTYRLVGWSLTSLFSTNMAISETKDTYHQHDIPGPVATI